MSKVIASAAMSLDGFVADPDDKVGPLFDFYDNGDVAFAGADPDRVFHTSKASADYMRAQWANIGAAVIGRRLFDLTDGWGGRPAVGEAVFVVTHRHPSGWPYPEAPFTFVTDGLASAISQAKRFAGARNVALTGGNLTGQALAAGLVDEISVALVPVLLGRGIRFFGEYAGPQVLFDNPDVIAGDRVTHLHYRRQNGDCGPAETSQSETSPAKTSTARSH